MSDFTLPETDVGSELEKELELGLQDFTKDQPGSNPYDLRFLAEKTLADLREFKRLRAEMVRQREDLNKRIRILEKRIEIAISAISTLQRPS